jgi:hypothetical protein
MLFRHIDLASLRIVLRKVSLGLPLLLLPAGVQKMFDEEFSDYSFSVHDRCPASFSFVRGGINLFTFFTNGSVLV